MTTACIPTDVWARAIDEAVLRVEGEPMVYGVSDCVSWVAGIVRSVTGAEFTPEWLLNHTNIDTAMVEAVARGGMAHVVGEAIKAAWQPLGDLACAPVGAIGLTTAGAVVINRGGFWIGRCERGVCGVRHDRLVAGWCHG